MPQLEEKFFIKILGKAAFVVFWHGTHKKMVMTDRAGLKEIRDLIDAALDNPLSNINGRTATRNDV